MNCRVAKQQIFAVRDGALDDIQRAALASHVAECAACRRIRDDLEIAVTGLRAESTAVRIPNPDLEWRKLQRQLHEPAPVRRSLASWLAVPTALAAAAAAVAVYVYTPSNPVTGSAEQAATVAGAQQTGSAPSAVVFVDDKSGWTFVLASDSGATGQHI